MNQKVDIEVFKRRLTVVMEGLNPLEISALAQKVHERMTKVSAQHGDLIDSSKLAILTAMEFAAELLQHEDARSTQNMALEKKVEELTVTLRAALSHVPAKK